MNVAALEDDIDTEDHATFARPRKRKEEEVDMDITPMIDMVFLLLIFFLVSSTPDQKTSIDLPAAKHGVAVTQEDSVIFTIAEGGAASAPVFAADGRIPGTELPDDPKARDERVQTLIEQGQREDKSKVIIKGDRNVAHRDVAQLIKAASKVSGVKLHLAVMDSE